MKCGIEIFNSFILVLLNAVSILILFCPLITSANYSLQGYSSPSLTRSWLKIYFPPGSSLDWVVFSYGTDQLGPQDMSPSITGTCSASIPPAQKPCLSSEWKWAKPLASHRLSSGLSYPLSQTGHFVLIRVFQACEFEIFFLCVI